MVKNETDKSSVHYYLAAHTRDGKAFHLPGMSGFKLTEGHVRNLKSGCLRGKAAVTVPESGSKRRVVVVPPGSRC